MQYDMIFTKTLNNIDHDIIIYVYLDMDNTALYTEQMINEYFQISKLKLIVLDFFSN